MNRERYDDTEKFLTYSRRMNEYTRIGENKNFYWVKGSVLQDLKTLEERRWNVYNKYREVLKRCFQPAFEMMFGKHVYGYYNNRHVVFEPFDDGITWNWVSCSEDIQGAVEDQDLVDVYFAAERHTSRYGMYHSIFTEALDHAVNMKYGKQAREKSKHGKRGTVHLTINGRNYWYEYEKYRLTSFSYPESKLISDKL